MIGFTRSMYWDLRDNCILATTSRGCPKQEGAALAGVSAAAEEHPWLNPKNPKEITYTGIMRLGPQVYNVRCFYKAGGGNQTSGAQKA